MLGRKAFILAIAALVLTGCGEEEAGQQPGGPTEVGVVTLQTESISLNAELPGRTSAFEVAEIRPQVSGIIQKRLFEEGGMVTKGQQLYQIDAAPFEAAYNTADAQLKRAQATLKSSRALAGRYKDLVSADAVSKQEYDDATARLGEAEADVAIAQANRDTAQINLNYTKVYSPITGRIGKSAVTPGALVTAAQAEPLALVQQLDPIYVDLTQSSSDLLKLRDKIAAGTVASSSGETPVKLVFDDLNTEYGQTGTLKFADVTVDPGTGNIQIRALFPNPDGIILPGLFVRARMTQGELTDALLVPQQAVTRSPDGKALAWVVDKESKAQQVPIETAEAIGDRWVVTSGLQSGDQVIVEGAVKIQPGAAVKAVPAGQKEETGAAAPEKPEDAEDKDSEAKADEESAPGETATISTQEPAEAPTEPAAEMAPANNVLPAKDDVPAPAADNPTPNQPLTNQTELDQPKTAEPESIDLNVPPLDEAKPAPAPAIDTTTENADENKAQQGE